MCRACALLPGAEAQLEKGKKSGRASAKVGLGCGILLLAFTLVLGIPALSSSGSRVAGRNTARLVGLGLSVGVLIIIASVRNLRTFSKPGPKP